MATIFISYRRGDKTWAQLVEATLSKDFDVFLDVDDIEPGEVFPDRFRDELADCSVVLVLIGPAWMAARNLERLCQPDDWVRQELATALARAPAIRVVPLQVEGAVMPSRAQLPPELHALSVRSAIPFDPWEAQKVVLRNHLSTWLSVPAINQKSIEPYPRVLPYLCDRIPQEDELELFRDARGALACVLHGLHLEGHDQFLERLEYQRMFEGLFRASASGVAMVRLNWNRELGKQGRWDLVLKMALRRQFQPADGQLSDDQLIELLSGPDRPHLFVVQVTSEDHRACGDDLIDRMVGAWLSLFPPNSGAPTLPRPFQPMLLWINFAYPRPPSRLPVQKVGRTLPVLSPLRDGDIREWTTHSEVRRVVARRERQLAGWEGDLFRLSKDPHYCQRDGSVHMLDFAKVVEQIFRLNQRR